MILMIFLIFGDFSLDDSYNINSHKKKVCMLTADIFLVSLYFISGTKQKIRRKKL